MIANNIINFCWVNIEEIRKNIDQHRLVGNDLLDGGTNALNAAGNIAFFIRLARGLLAVFSSGKLNASHHTAVRPNTTARQVSMGTPTRFMIRK